KLREKGINFVTNTDQPGKEAFQRNRNKLVISQEIAETVWQKYRREQDEEYPTLLAQYEKSLEPAKFPEHAVTETEDISGDKRYIILKDKGLVWNTVAAGISLRNAYKPLVFLEPFVK
ncbi:MAG: hypothetical protein QG588_885, partial [Candidatus Poribacteria bacterium]|nr:hypothetical protein [Candidatus Poribacteria bacterium]